MFIITYTHYKFTKSKDYLNSYYCDFPSLYAIKIQIFYVLWSSAMLAGLHSWNK